MRKATLKDIATATGVSAMTVSKALNNKGGVSPATRQRILEVAKELHYSQNLVAKSLRVDETKTLGVVLSDSSEMVTSRILRGIQDVSSANGFSVITVNTDHKPDAEHTAIQTLISKRIDGLLLVAPTLNSDEDMEWLRNLGVPFTMLMRQNPEAMVDTVINDNYLGGYQSVEHLVQQGCQTFFFLMIENSISSQERLRGYKQALNDFRIDEKKCKFVSAAPSPEAGFNAIIQSLEHIRDYDAVVCGCDIMAMGAMEALLDAGIQIPKDICLIGYDGIEPCRYLRVPLTTVAQPLYQIGAQGTDVLLDRIKYPDTAVRKMVLKSELIVRQSTQKK